jgi:hypothetical protein
MGVLSCAETWGYVGLTLAMVAIAINAVRTDRRIIAIKQTVELQHQVLLAQQAVIKQLVQNDDTLSQCIEVLATGGRTNGRDHTAQHAGNSQTVH